MPCNKPLLAYRDKDGVHFTPPKGDALQLELPCGNCLACRLAKAQERAIRCINEASMHENNIFLTLTFDNENLPEDKNIDWEILKKFFKKLRVKYSTQKIRYYACGEYGGEFNYDNEAKVWLWDRRNYREPKPNLPRVHFHAIIFNYRPKDEEILYSNKHGQEVYSSMELTKIWGNGHISYGEVTPQSCGYVARYVTKKQNNNPKNDYVPKYGQEIYDLETGELICTHPTQPEIAFGSARPAIGATWLEKYWKTDCFNQGFIVGPAPEYKKQPIPRYYWEWLDRNYPDTFKEYKELAAKAFQQKKAAIEADNTRERQDTKEFILGKKTETLIREL